MYPINHVVLTLRDMNPSFSSEITAINHFVPDCMVF